MEIIFYLHHHVLDYYKENIHIQKSSWYNNDGFKNVIDKWWQLDKFAGKDF